MPTDSEKLAIHGGPAILPKGPPDWPRPEPAVQQALQAAYSDGSWGKYHGPHCGRLIQALAAMHRVEHVTLCCSGTVAVELALRGLQVREGDEVILAGYDFPGNFRAIEAIGARPVLVDIDPASWCLDAGKLPEAISDRTRAIIVSHLHGTVAPMSDIMAMAQSRGVPVLEDACQVPGALVEGKVAGRWGDVSVMSFGGSKLLTAGRGGAVLTSAAEVQQRIKVFADRGNNAFPMSELQAAVLLPQLELLEAQNARRAINVARLREFTAPLQQLRAPAHNTPGEPSYYKLAWRYESGQSDTQAAREQLIAAVRAEGVALDAGFRGFTRRSERRCRKVGDLTHSTEAAESTVLLHHPVLLESAETIEKVARAIHKVHGGLKA